MVSARSREPNRSASQPPRPRPLNETVRRQMSSMPRRDTTAELAVRRELHRLGLRYRVDLRTLPGTPDIALTRARVAIFVDGCFWHRCPDHGTAPKNNSEWWVRSSRRMLHEIAARTRNFGISGGLSSISGSMRTLGRCSGSLWNLAGTYWLLGGSNKEDHRFVRPWS